MYTPGVSYRVNTRGASYSLRGRPTNDICDFARKMGLVHLAGRAYTYELGSAFRGQVVAPGDPRGIHGARAGNWSVRILGRMERKDEKGLPGPMFLFTGESTVVLWNVIAFRVHLAHLAQVGEQGAQQGQLHVLLPGTRDWAPARFTYEAGPKIYRCAVEFLNGEPVLARNGPGDLVPLEGTWLWRPSRQ
jgi:hypothetical protein